jgi:lipoprotein NlpI
VIENSGEIMRTIALSIALLLPAGSFGEDAKELLNKAREALQEKKYDEALSLTETALAADPANAEGHFLRGRIFAQQNKLEQAVAEFTTTLKISPRFAPAYDQRGTASFRLGKINQSIADYDEQIKLDPDAGPAHWRRGLALYYAERFSDGVAQFTTSDNREPNDVENAVWHLMCNARVKGLEKARNEILAVKQDPRGETMMKVYRLFKGDVNPADVLASAEAGNVDETTRRSRRFYANYYVGMHYEALGQQQKSLELIKTAIEKHPVGDYMMDVARVHLQLREKK